MINKETLSNSIEDLSNFLKSFNIPLAKWGRGDAKTIAHLLKEIKDGDTELVVDGEEVIRQVSFANIDVYAIFEGYLHRLREDRQVFDEGLPTERIRRRSNPNAVKEKFHRTENIEEAIQRAVHEELKVSGEIAAEQLFTEKLDVESPSYPGLRSKYVVYNYKAELTGDQINPNGYKEVQPDKTTYFLWDIVK